MNSRSFRLRTYLKNDNENQIKSLNKNTLLNNLCKRHIITRDTYDNSAGRRTIEKRERQTTKNTTPDEYRARTSTKPHLNEFKTPMHAIKYHCLGVNINIAPHESSDMEEEEEEEVAAQVAVQLSAPCWSVLLSHSPLVEFPLIFKP